MAERTTSGRCSLVLASVVVILSSSANLFVASASASSSSSWNAPLRIGVQATIAHNKIRKKRVGFLLSAKPWKHHGDDENAVVYASSAATSQKEDSSDDDEWYNALFQQEEDKQFKYASAAGRTTTTATTATIRRSATTTNSFDHSRGFRQSLQLPSFLKRSRVRRGEDADTLPCAAISVSSKSTGGQQLASFSSGMQGRGQSTKKPPHPTLNHRKEAASTKPQPTTTTTGSKQKSTKEEPTGRRPLVFWENMVCGAISRSVAQTVMHPANTMKTLLQQSNSAPLMSYMKPDTFPVLFRGAGANLVLSIPHGAINFAVLEMVRKELSRIVQRTKYSEEKIGPALDFMSSAISTICCSVVSTPQMMITDNIMAGNYPNLPQAVKGLYAQGNGISGFYARGWWPGLVGKIPSYALTWTIFQQLKVAQRKLSGREATNLENSIMGCLASGTTVTIMIPMDTIKTRLVTQATSPGVVPYKGIVDCAVRVVKEEGVKSFYRGLPPRLVSVVPMIGIQFTVYEFMKRVMQKRALAEQKQQHQQQHQQHHQQQPSLEQSKPILSKRTTGRGRRKRRNNNDEDDAENFDPYSSYEQLQESCMEVAASPEHPYPAPHFLRVMRKKGGRNGKRAS